MHSMHECRRTTQNIHLYVVLDVSARLRPSGNSNGLDAIVVVPGAEPIVIPRAEQSVKLNRNNKLLGTSASLLVTSALLVVTISY